MTFFYSCQHKLMITISIDDTVALNDLIEFTIPTEPDIQDPITQESFAPLAPIQVQLQFDDVDVGMQCANPCMHACMYIEMF